MLDRLGDLELPRACSANRVPPARDPAPQATGAEARRASG